MPKTRYNSHVPEQVSISTTVVPETSLFSIPRDGYDQENFTFGAGRDSWLLENRDVSSETEVFCYDAENEHLLLSTKNVDRGRVDAVDRYRILLNTGSARLIPGMDGTSLPSVLKVSFSGEDKTFRFVVIVKPTTDKLSITYQESTSSGTRGGPLERGVRSGVWQAVAFDVAVGNGTGLLSVQLPSGNVAAASLAPLGVSFEGKSYDTFGRVFVDYNQNALMKRYEYDGAGRVIKIYDEKGNLLQKFDYTTLY